MHEEKHNVILCGFMATGKSSVGKRLAAEIGYDFFDLDSLIEAEAGMSIAEIFAARGEAAFRLLEASMVERLADRKCSVLATGGGTVADRRNLETLKRNGVIVALSADPQAILSRIGSGDDRPMLKGTEKLERIRTLMQQRAEAYAEADITIDTSSKTIEEVVDRILDWLRKRK